MSKLNLEQLERDLNARRGRTAPAPQPEPPAEATPKNVVEMPSAFREDEPWIPDGEKYVRLPEILDAAAFVAQELVRPPELIKGLLHQGTKMVIGGGSKSFKTWIQLDAAISVANGVPWMDKFEVVQGRVLYVNFEIHPVFFKERINSVYYAKKIKEVSPKTLDVWNLRGHAAAHGIIVPQIIKRIEAEGYALVVIDPIYKLYGSTDENSAGEVAELMNGLERICVETKAAVMFGAHYSKGNQAAKESIDRISGSGVFARDPDTIMPFTVHEEEGCFTVEPILRNMAPCPAFVTRWQFPVMTVDDDLDPTRLKQQNKGRKKEYDATKLLEFIRQHTVRNPITITDWAKAAGIKRQTLADYLPALRQIGYIATQGAGTTSMQYLTEKGTQFLDAQDNRKVTSA